MTRDEIQDILRRELGAIAPEADLAGIDPEAELTDALDIDSMDFLNLVVGLHRALAIEIPEADYRALRSLRAATDYLAGRLS